MSDIDKKTRRIGLAPIFPITALIWLLFDRTSKAMVDGVQPGQTIEGGIPGLFGFRLVHNTGAAWGMFGNSTVALGVFSVLVCAFVVWYVYGLRKGRVSALEAFGLGLVFAGGLGNAFDRFVHGYVIDFINLSFIDFPVFNVADIGVTCGVVLFLIGWWLHDIRQRELDGSSSTDGGR